MDYPVKVLTLTTLSEKCDPDRIIPRFTVLECTGRFFNTHTYYVKEIDNPHSNILAHITSILFLKPETNPGLYRRAFNRKGCVSQEYYTSSYNSLIEFQLRSCEEKVGFCMTSEDAVKQAILWDMKATDETETAQKKCIYEEKVRDYMLYAQRLEKFELLVDQYYKEETLSKTKELK